MGNSDSNNGGLVNGPANVTGVGEFRKDNREKVVTLVSLRRAIFKEQDGTHAKEVGQDGCTSREKTGW